MAAPAGGSGAAGLDGAGPLRGADLLSRLVAGPGGVGGGAGVGGRAPAIARLGARAAYAWRRLTAGDRDAFGGATAADPGRGRRRTPADRRASHRPAAARGGVDRAAGNDRADRVAAAADGRGP